VLQDYCRAALVLAFPDHDHDHDPVVHDDLELGIDLLDARPAAWPPDLSELRDIGRDLATELRMEQPSAGLLADDLAWRQPRAPPPGPGRAAARSMTREHPPQAGIADSRVTGDPGLECCVTTRLSAAAPATPGPTRVSGTQPRQCLAEGAVPVLVELER
jgi:hypothetical protein